MLMEIRMMIAYPWVHGNGDAAAEAAAAAISLIPSTTTMTTLPRAETLRSFGWLSVYFASFLFLDFNWQKFSFAGVFFASSLADPAAGAVEAAMPASCQSVSLLAFEELFLNVTYA